MNRFKDGVVAITGAASGIGRAAATLFSSEGGRVVLLDIDATGGEAVRIEITAAGGEAVFVPTDVSKADQVEAAFEAATEAFGRLDAIVNVVGVSGRRWGDGPVHSCTEEAWDRLMAINLKSVFLCCKEAIGRMLPQGRGAIVNISSVLGLVGGDEDFATHAYGTTKGAIVSLTRSIAAYYAPRGIRANVICPALVRTAMTERAQQSDRIRSRLKDLQPLTGDFAEPEDVANAALYLASQEAKFVTGAVLTVDGGWTAR